MNSLFRLLVLGSLWLTITAVQAQTSTLATVEQNGSRGTRLNLVFLSEGYTSGEMGTFASDVEDAIDFLFTREPWVRYRSYCNIYRIEIASNQSGTDYVIPSFEYTTPKSVDTYFNTGFVTQGISQLNILTGSGTSRVYALLNKHVPEYDIPIVLINDPRYGGSGGPIALTTTDPSSIGILEHELGHSFAKLTDEYDEEYPGYPNTEYPNATAKTVRDQIRWKVWMKDTTPLKTPENDPLYEDEVGHFEGANYHKDNWFRPHDNALMRNLYRPPGHVTREHIVLTYYSKVSPIDSFSPSKLSQTFTAPAPLTLSVEVKVPSTAPTLSVEWQDNGVTIPGETGNSLVRNTKAFGNGVHKIKAIVRDPTDWVRRDPTGLVVEEVTWTLNLSNQTDPPEIITPLPASRVLAVDDSLMLDGTADGPGPIGYQWLRNNAPLKPAVTTPTLNLSQVTLADAGTYTVKITNPGHTRTHSCVLAVLDPNVPKLVVGKGKNATLAFLASANLPPVSWKFGPTLISNGGRYSKATTKALQIKGVVEADEGSYTFECGEYGPSPAIELLVVTGKPDYTDLMLSALDPGFVGGNYNRPFPLPTNVHLTPNSFSAAKLPAGLKMDPKTGRIIGQPTKPSTDQTNGDEVVFTVGNEFGKIALKLRMLIRPMPPGIEGIFSGPIFQNSTLGGTTGGRIDVSVLSTGAYSGKAIIGTETLQFKGVMLLGDPDISLGLSPTFTLKPKHAAQPISIQFTIDGRDDADPLTATLYLQDQFSAWRNRWLPPEALDPFKGYHTFALTVPVDADAPKGNGYGSVTIDAAGKTVVAGKLADGESFTTTSHLGPTGGVLIYQALYTTPVKGGLVAVLDLDPAEGQNPPLFTNEGVVNWLRPADLRPTARVYKSGFGPLELDAFGGLYTPPGKNEIVMGLPPAAGTPPTNARLSFDQLLGDDPFPVNADVTLEIKPSGAPKVNAPNPKAVTFSVTPKDGLFKGNYMTKDEDPRPPLSPSKPRPLVPRKADYQGIIVRESGELKGYGFLLREALPKADGSTTPTTSPKHSGSLLLRNSNL